MLFYLSRKAVALVRVCFKKWGSPWAQWVLEDPLQGELIKGGLMLKCSKGGDQARSWGWYPHSPGPHFSMNIWTAQAETAPSIALPMAGGRHSCTTAQGFCVSAKRGHRWGHSGQLKNISALKALTVQTFGEGSQSSACKGCVKLLRVETLFFFLNICAIHKRLSVKKVKAALNTTRTLFYCSVSSFVCSKWMHGQLCLIIINCIF